MTDPLTPPAGCPTKPCQGPGCPGVLTRTPGMRRHRWDEVKTCSRSCGSRLAAVTRKGGQVESTTHTCALPGCEEVVPRIDGEPPSRHLARRYCSDAHRRTAGNRNRARVVPPWKVERDCVCGARYTPRKKTQKFHDASCATAQRRTSPQPVARTPRRARPKPVPPPTAQPPPTAPTPVPSPLPVPTRSTWRPSWLRDYGNGLSRVTGREACV